MSSEENFLESALTTAGLNTLDDFFRWFKERSKTCQFEVCRQSLADLDGWYFEKDTGNLVHHSGKFFAIEGIEVQTNFGRIQSWMQPIINQPEIGILGFLTKKISGILHFLVQAKMEPGNVNVLQISPTVQATRSNYTKVHGGKKVPYLEWFIGHPRACCLVDQLQSEQGARFLAKRNRNIIVEVEEDTPVDVREDFYWLTLGQLLDLLKLDNIVNMDSRTVLSCIRYRAMDEGLRAVTAISSQTEFSEDVYVSSLVDERYSFHSFDMLISWLTQLKSSYYLNVRRIPLNKTANWYFDGNTIRNRTGRFFSVIGVSVSIHNREVSNWHQPLIESIKGGILCFICQKKSGVLHFLVQARVEPGNYDCIEMAPTVQCTPSNYDPQQPDTFPPFFDIVMKARPEQIRYSALQSEEGGRFYHDENRYMVLELDKNDDVALPENYIWMTISQMKEFIRFNNYFNIEARGLISCLGIKKPA